MSTEKTQENRIRRLALKEGFWLRKSRARTTHINNWGGYMLVNDRNCIELGERFDLSLADVERYLSDGNAA